MKQMILICVILLFVIACTPEQEVSTTVEIVESVEDKSTTPIIPEKDPESIDITIRTKPTVSATLPSSQSFTELENIEKAKSEVSNNTEENLNQDIIHEVPITSQDLLPKENPNNSIQVDNNMSVVLDESRDIMPFRNIGEGTTQQSTLNITEMSMPAVVQIMIYDITGTQCGLGSGFFIAPGKILTNAHVVEGAYSAEVLSDAEHYDKITVLKSDDDIDLALLLVENRSELILQFEETQEIRPGQHIVTIGNPMGLTKTVSDGLVSAIRSIPGQFQAIQISAPVSPGSSGGPLLNQEGRVIGIVSATLYEGQNLNFAIGIRTIQDFLSKPDDPKLLHSAGSRVIWRVILKWVGNIILGLIALVFGGGWFVILIAIFLFYGVFWILRGMFKLVTAPFRKKQATVNYETSNNSYIYEDTDEDETYGTEIIPRGNIMRKIIGTIGEGILGTLLIIIFIFNSFAGIVGGIWLLCTGYWRIVISGFLISLFMPYWWIIVSLPSLGFMFLLGLFIDKKSKVGVAIVGFIAGLYDSFLIMGWLALVFTYALFLVWEQKAPFYPMLLFAYSIATSPLLYMASKEPPDSEGTNLTMTLVVIGSIIIVILAFFSVPLIYPWIILFILMLLRTFLLTAIGVSMIPKRNTDYLSNTLMRDKYEDYYDQEIDSEAGYTEDDEEYDYGDEYSEDEYGFDNE